MMNARLRPRGITSVAALLATAAIAASAQASLTAITAEAIDGDINGSPVRITRVYVLASSTADRIGQVQAFPLGGSATYHHRDILIEGEYSTAIGSFSPSFAMGGVALDSYVTVGNTINPNNGTQAAQGWGADGLNRPDFPAPTDISGHCSWVTFTASTAGPNALGRILVAQFVTDREDVAAWTFTATPLNGGTAVYGTVLVSPDLCPDSVKSTPGQCGCDSPDTDSDQDGASDCNDAPTATVALPMPLADAKVNPWGFGTKVVASGDWIAVGAPKSIYLTALTRGAVLLFRRSAGGWTQVQTVVAPLEFPASPSAADGFGSALAMHGDMLFVGAPSRRVAATGSLTRGTVYAFRLDARSQKWTPRQTIVSPRAAGGTLSTFGGYLAFDPNAMRLCVADLADRVQPSHAGTVSILEPDTDGLWTEQAYVANPGIEANNYTGFGRGLACFGDELAVGAPGAVATNPGLVFVFHRDAKGAWTLRQTLSRPSADGNPTGFGSSIGMNARTLAVASSFITVPAPWGLSLPAKNYAGVVVHERAKNGLWEPVGDLVAPDLVAALAGGGDAFPELVLDGDRLSFTTALGLRNYVYRRVGGSSWTQHAKATYGPLPYPWEPGSTTLAGPMLVSAYGPSMGWEDGTLSAQDLGLADCDGDGVADPDSDGDGLPDCTDPDDDGDGVDE